jgi:ferredoxin
VSQLKDIEIVGEVIDEIRVTGFRFPKSMEPQWGLPRPLRWFLRNALTARPYIRRDLCKLCEICVKGCPPGALTKANEKIEVDYSRCIRCFCCSEFCPEQAIGVRRGWPLRLFKGSS